MTDQQSHHEGEDAAHDEESQPLGAFLRRQRELAELTLNQFASTIGISNAYLSQIERGLRQPSRQVLSSIASGLHLSAEAIEGYSRPAPPATSAVLDAIERDSRLTSRQRSLLADTYRSFVELNEARQRPAGEHADHEEDQTP
jgi:transcriptional regulator with XRE-family HTH domain